MTSYYLTSYEYADSFRAAEITPGVVAFYGYDGEHGMELWKLEYDPLDPSSSISNGESSGTPKLYFSTFGQLITSMVASILCLLW